MKNSTKAEDQIEQHFQPGEVHPSASLRRSSGTLDGVRQVVVIIGMSLSPPGRLDRRRSRWLELYRLSELRCVQQLIYLIVGAWHEFCVRIRLHLGSFLGRFGLPRTPSTFGFCRALSHRADATYFDGDVGAKKHVDPELVARKSVKSLQADEG